VAAQTRRRLAARRRVPAVMRLLLNH